jgi:hypothetical protein
VDLAVTIFYVGVGAGALLIGLALLILVVSLRRLSRDARVLADDVRRLNRTLDQLVDARAGEEEPAPPAAADEELVGWWPGRESDGPVQSADQRKDERFA